ncbi:hypothetical protein [Myxococcus sp. Y35]|uniref:hypothetical protein n=1 Tax=Pseudomyxococcus flavus TaxID=3115648 RepID=UPI003CF32EA4
MGPVAPRQLPLAAMEARLRWLLGATTTLTASPAWAQGAENALGALFSGVIALGVLFVAVVVGVVTLGINHLRAQRHVSIALGILAGLAQACVGGGFLLAFVISSIQSVFANGSVAFGGASLLLPFALGLLVLGLYVARVAWRARAPAALPPHAR